MEIGVIGTGTMGRNHVRIYSELKSVDSVVIHDVNSRAALALAEKHGAEALESVDKVLDRADAVSICVPTEYHFEIAQKAAAAGVDMLVEKPLCASAEEALRLIEIIPDGMIAGTGHIERFNPVVDEIKRISKKPLYVDIKRHNPASARISGSTVVEDLMIHDIDIVLHALFPSECTLLRSAGSTEVCGAMLRSNSTPIYLSASRKASKKIRMIYIEEEEFTIEGDFMSQEVFIYRKPGQYTLEDERYVQENIIEKVMVNKLEPLKVELETFVDCVKTRKEFPITLQDALSNLEMCERVREMLSA